MGMRARGTRAPRPVTSYFDQSALAEKLQPLAKLKERVLGFCWDGSDYLAGRGKAADVQGLKKHAKVLDILLDFAPSGFPSQPTLRATFRYLHAHSTIFENLDERHAFKRTTEAADNWRVMMRHIYDLANTGTDTGCEVVDNMAKKIELPKATATDGAESNGDDEGATAAEQPPPAQTELGPAEVQSLFPPMDVDDTSDHGTLSAETVCLGASAGAVDTVSSSDDECQMTQVTCNCEECMAKLRVSCTTSSAATSGLASSGATSSGTPTDPPTLRIPDPKRGGQKQETLKKRTRLTAKTADPTTTPPKAAAPDKDTTLENKKLVTPKKMRMMRLRRPSASKATPSASKATSPPGSSPTPGVLKLPIKMTERKPKVGRCGEAYLVHCVKDTPPVKWQFVAGLSSNSSDDYLAKICELKRLIEQKAVTTIQEAKAWASENA
ncbi:unnamed protein product [Prorocentrum cordatum]|uniref:Uncharacterized protein n=1 Tax=Prorocentrum cordatum TaxID=2364126 RepID=A0ABN9T5P9_9DINO|nr:unnamed protein product [Polarella glacialis]